MSRRNSSSVPQSPTLAAQLKTQSAPATPAAERLGVFQVADDLLHAPLVEPAGVAGGPDQSPDAMAAFQGLFGRVAADQPGGAGDEDRFRQSSVSMPAGDTFARRM